MHHVAAMALLVVAAMGLDGPAAWATRPKSGLTKGEAIKAFVDAANLACIYSTVSRTPLEALPSGVEDDLAPADAEDLRGSLAKGQPLWVSKSLGNLLQVFVDKNGVCTVVATQLPVQATLDAEAGMLRGLGGSTYTERPFKPGDNPIGYEFVRMVDGDLVTIRMEGAEPGLPGHMSRFSLMWLRVSRKAASP
jgi:hypothetical protein